jgi:hypothetical protein
MIVSRQLIGLLLAASVVSACGRDGTSAGAGGPGDASSGHLGGTPNSSGPATPPTGAPGGPRLVVPVAGLHQIRPSRWQSAAGEPGSETVTVAFWSAPCYEAAHVRVDERPGRVVITLYLGIPASSLGRPCVESAEYRAVRVVLSGPLGNRRIVDGTPGSAEPPGPGSATPPARPGAG